MPPYVVFGDAALRDMARRRPSTLEAFLEVRGVGQRKCAEFGEAFVGEIVSYCTSASVPLNVSPSPTASRLVPEPGADARNNAPTISALAAFDHFRRGASIDEVMQQFGRARSTVAGYLHEYLRHEQVLDPSPWLDAAAAVRIEAAIEETGADRLKPVFDRLGGEIPYDQIRIMAICMANRDSA